MGAEIFGALFTMHDEVNTSASPHIPVDNNCILWIVPMPSSQWKYSLICYIEHFMCIKINNNTDSFHARAFNQNMYGQPWRFERSSAVTIASRWQFKSSSQTTACHPTFHPCRASLYFLIWPRPLEKFLAGTWFLSNMLSFLWKFIGCLET